LTAIRESIPTEAIIRAYLDESIEDEEEVIIEPIVEEEEKKEEVVPKQEEPMMEIPKEELPATLSVENVNNEKPVTRLTFNDIDDASDGTSIDAPKSIERLEEISARGNMMRKSEEDDEEEEESGNIKIHMNEDVTLDNVFDLDKPTSDSDLLILDGVEDL